MALKPILRRSVRLLAAVHELHKQGYQDLSVYTGMASSGFYWRCLLVPHDEILYQSGRLKTFTDYGPDQANHSSGESGNEYFGWNDAKQDNARELAQKIKQRFPRLIAKTRRANYQYAGWFTEMLGMAEQGNLPVMYDDYPVAHESKQLKSTGNVEIPRPPHESVWEFNGKVFAYKNAPHLEEGEDWHEAYRRVIDSWRSADVAFLPKYPVATQDTYEIGAYWEGAIYYIQNILGFHRIDQFLKSLDTFDQGSERWHTFQKVWNNSGQLEFLKAFLTRSMLMDEQKYSLEQGERRQYESWLNQFERAYNPMGQSSPEHLPYNPYFGGNNPLHLGVILSGQGRDRLIKA